MKQGSVRGWAAVLAAMWTVGCAGTQMSQQQVSEAFAGKPVSDILVIVVANDEKIRGSLERRFVNQLRSLGVEAESRVDVIPIPSDMKLDKETILKAVSEQGNDGVLITHLVDIQLEEAVSRGAMAGPGFYDHYGFLYDQVRNPAYGTTYTTLTLETNLYDAKTEQRIWSGRSRTLQKDPAKPNSGEMVKVVVGEMLKSNVIAPK